MPTLPGYNSKANIQVNTPAPQRAEDPLRHEAAIPFEQDQGVLKTMGDITQKISDANDVMQYTQAKASYETSVEKIHAAAALDTGITMDANGNPTFTDPTPKYLAQLQEVQKNASSGISNQLVASKAQIEFNHGSEISAIKIGADFKGKQLTFNAGQAFTVLNAEQNKVINGTPNEQLQAEANIHSFLNEQITSGAMSVTQARRALVEARTVSAENGIFSNTAQTIQQLKDPNGPFKDLPSDAKTTLIINAERYQKRQQMEATEIQKQASLTNESNMVMSIAQGGDIPSAADMAKMVRTGTMNSDFAESALKAQTSPDAYDARTDGEQFSKLTQEIMKSNDTEGLRKAVQNILQGGGDGKISKPDMQILIQSAMAQGKRQKAMQSSIPFSNAVTSLNDWAKQSGVPRADVFREFQKQVANGADLGAATDAAKKTSIINNVPGASSLTDVPNIVIGKDSNVRYIFPKQTTVYPNRIYDPKTGKLEVNKDKAVSSK